jgi:hypothetical protein
MRSFLAALSLFFFSCSSTNVTVSPALKPQGKVIYIQPIKLTQQQRKSGNTDSICTCTAQAIERAIIPYLQQKGFTVITSSGDSLKSAVPTNADYVLVGSGTVHVFGSSTFVESLSLEIKDKPMNGSLAVAGFTGVSIRANRAGERIGKALIKKIE